MTGENIETHLSRTAVPAAAAVSPGSADSGAKHRRSLLELAPLELDCMHALWILGPATVRDVRDRIAPHRPRAYTTIMTILDRLARKGAVERSKVGRAYLYRASLSAEDARRHAVGQVIENFFGGSSEALLSQLHNSGVRVARTGSLRSAGAAVPTLLHPLRLKPPAVMAAEAGAASASSWHRCRRCVGEPGARDRTERHRASAATKPPAAGRNAALAIEPNMFPTEIKIRDLDIRPATILAPMAGVTDTVFRRVIRELGGCGLIMTEFTSAEGLTRNSARTLRYLYFAADEHPIAAQIFGAVPQ